MIKILLVDEAPAIRQYIRHSIDWRTINAEIVAEAADGKEAFYLAVKYSPDIIITDIELPICDGMELISNLQRIYTPAKIIIFTNVQSEDYLLKALRLGVKDYILKQSNISYMKVILKKLCDQIQEKQNYSDGILKNKTLFQKYLRDIQSGFMSSSIIEDMLSPDLQEEAQRLNIYLGGPNYQIILFHCEPIQYWNALAYIEQFSQEFHPSIWFTKQSDLYAILLNIKNAEHSQSLLLHITKKYKNIFNANSQNIVLTPATTDLSKLAAHYHLGLRLACCSILFCKGETLMTADGPSLATTRFETDGLFHEEQQLVLGLKSMGIQDYEVFVDKYIQALRTAFSTDSDTRHSLLRILFGVVVRDNLLLSELRQRCYEIQSISHMDTLRRFLEALYHSMGVSTEYNSILIQKVKHYVEENYADKISLNAIAKTFYVSAPYLSSLFHKEVNIPFNHWLQQYRIERSKALLSTGKYKNYEIASLVGYADYKTFAKYFNRYTGKNTREFMNQFILGPNLEGKEKAAPK